MKPPIRKAHRELSICRGGELANSGSQPWEVRVSIQDLSAHCGCSIRKMHLQISDYDFKGFLELSSWNLANKLLTYHLEMIIYVAETSTRETKYHTWRAGELRSSTLGGPEDLTLQALSPKQRG